MWPIANTSKAQLWRGDAINRVSAFPFEGRKRVIERRDYECGKPLLRLVSVTYKSNAMSRDVIAESRQCKVEE